MRRPIVAGNWKMHGTRAENAVLLDALLGSALIDSIAECIVCPPFVYLQDVVRALRGSPIQVGAQDVCAEPQGAFTGEVSAHMIRDIGCTHTIVGHSERRTICGESDTLVARKFASAFNQAEIADNASDLRVARASGTCPGAESFLMTGARPGARVAFVAGAPGPARGRHAARRECGRASPPRPCA